MVTRYRQGASRAGELERQRRTGRLCDRDLRDAELTAWACGEAMSLSLSCVDTAAILCHAVGVEIRWEDGRSPFESGVLVVSIGPRQPIAAVSIGEHRFGHHSIGYSGPGAVTE